MDINVKDINYRVLATVNEDSDTDREYDLKIIGVFYGPDNRIMASTDASVGLGPVGHDIETLRTSAAVLSQAFEAPLLYESDLPGSGSYIDMSQYEDRGDGTVVIPNSPDVTDEPVDKPASDAAAVLPRQPHADGSINPSIGSATPLPADVGDDLEPYVKPGQPNAESLVEVLNKGETPDEDPEPGADGKNELPSEHEDGEHTHSDNE